MTSTKLRARIKPFVPTFWWVAMRRCHAWTIRGRIWLAIAREISGVSHRDKLILRQSLRIGLKRITRDSDIWQDPELIEDADVEARGVGRFHVRAGTDDLYHVLPSREDPVVSAIRARLRAGGAFVDAGANIGFFTVLAARIVGPGGRVFAIEMLPVTADQLRRNIDANELSNVTLLQYALSDRDGETLLATIPRGKFGRASIVRNSEDSDQVQVEARTLDSLLVDSGPIDLLKMDLESAEFLALKGAPRVLRTTRSIIFEELDGETSARKLLEAAGFLITNLDGSNLLAERRDVSATATKPTKEIKRPRSGGL